MSKLTREAMQPALAAVSAVRACADTMQMQAANLLQSLPQVPMDEALRTKALELVTALHDTANRVMFEVALLQTELGEGKADAAAAVSRLSGLDAAMMAKVAAVADVVDQLEKAAEGNEAYERAFVLVIEAVGTLLQTLEQAKESTVALQATQGRRSREGA